MGIRITAVIPLITSAVVVALSITLLVSGSDTSQANNNYWLAINTSGVGGNLVEVSAVDDLSSSSSLGALGGLINDIPGLTGILDNLTTAIGDGIGDLQGQLLGNITSGLGLKEFYVLYSTKMCEGDLEDAKSPNSNVKITSCYTYSDEGHGLLNITNSIPSTFVVGTAQVSVPLVATLKQSLDSIVTLGVGATTTIMVFLIIGAVTEGLTLIGSLFGVLRSQSRLLTRLNLVFSTLAVFTIAILALAMTIVILVGSNIIGGFGSGLSIHIKNGNTFLALIWVSAVLSAATFAYWFTIWFVEFRRSAFSRRSRTTAQIGNYMGIFGEVKKDIKVDGHFPNVAMHSESSKAEAP